MGGSRVDFVAGAQFHDLSEIHHCDARRDVANNREVMCDHEIGHSKLFLKIHQEVEDLRLDGYVESGDGLVEYQ